MGRKVTIVELIRREGREPGGRSRRRRRRWVPAEVVIKRLMDLPPARDKYTMRFVGRAMFGENGK